MTKTAAFRTLIQTPHGIYEGIAPVIVSASRATDIPAFHMDWLLQRLREGYCVWQNPFNRKRQYISFQNLRAVVFWTKNPEPFLLRIDEFEQWELTYYFQFTLNDYEAEQFEPNIPPLEQRIETFQKLSRQIGKERIIWRFDPILLADGLTVEDIFERIYFIGDRLSGYTEKLVFSFVDIANYPKVHRRLKRIALHVREPVESEIHRIAEWFAGQCEHWKMQLATCCEKIDFTSYGIAPNRCVDPELLRRLAPNDQRLTVFLTQTAKDKGQRKYCGCIVSKDIGQYETCPHYCVYCYANR
jgi:DNA repair photolyase